MILDLSIREMNGKLIDRMIMRQEWKLFNIKPNVRMS